jgi:hypothetical protein
MISESSGRIYYGYLTVGVMAVSWFTDQMMSTTRRWVDLAVELRLPTITITNPDIDLAVFAACAYILHDEILLQIGEPGNVTWFVERAALFCRVSQRVAERAVTAGFGVAACAIICHIVVAAALRIAVLAIVRPTEPCLTGDGNRVGRRRGRGSRQNG